jgi:hypothetical protein
MVPVKLYIEYASTYLKKKVNTTKIPPKKSNNNNDNRKRRAKYKNNIALATNP